MEPTVFTFSNILYTAIGAAVLWGKLGGTKLKAYVLADFLNIFPINERLKSIIEFIVFLVLGCIVGIGVISPSTPVQALAAGFGWTGLVSKPIKNR